MTRTLRSTGARLPCKSVPRVSRKEPRQTPHSSCRQGPPLGWPLGAEIPPTPPAPIRPVRVRAATVGGVDLTLAPARHDDAWGRSGGGLRAWSGGVRTGGAGWLFDEACKGFRRTVALRAWGWRGQGCRARG